MRIAVDGRPLCHPHTGIGVYVYEVLSRIAAEHELFVYSDRPLPQAPSFPATFRSGPARRLAGQATAAFGFGQWANRDLADVYWGTRHNLPLSLGRLPAVVTIHDLVWRRMPETMHPLNRLLDSFYMPLALRRADRVLAVSEDTAMAVRRFSGHQQVHAVPLAARAMSGASEPFHHPRPYFLFVGQKEPRKNLLGLVEGFRRATAHGLTEHDLILVGPEAWKLRELASAIDAAGLRRRVVDLGAVSAPRLAGVYRSCTALVLASFYEGFGLPLLEAMQFGKPVITSDSGAMAEIGGDAALLVDPQRVDDISAALLRLTVDRTAYRRLAASALRRCRRYSWERTAKATLAVLDAARLDRAQEQSQRELHRQVDRVGSHAVR